MSRLSTLAATASLVIVGFAAVPATAQADHRDGMRRPGVQVEAWTDRGASRYDYGRRGPSLYGNPHYGYVSPSSQYGYSGRGWTRLEGYFTVRADLCPDLIEDRYDARRSHGRFARADDYRDRLVLSCPDRAWDYVPSRSEARMGRTGDRLRPSVAYLDRRSGVYFADTRWGEVPVQIIDRYDHGYRTRSTGVSFRLQLH